MKKIIEGALYNTKTAKKKGYWDNGCPSTDFNNCEETLYRTKAGKYFIYGSGGGNSKYGEWHGNSGGPGEEIRPYTSIEAMEWAENKLDADEYAAIFGELEEAGDNREALNISLPVILKSKLDRLKSEKGKSISALIEDAVNNYYGIN